MVHKIVDSCVYIFKNLMQFTGSRLSFSYMEISFLDIRQTKDKLIMGVNTRNFKVFMHLTQGLSKPKLDMLLFH